MTESVARGGSFSRRVTAVFSTKVVAFALALATTLVISRILGPAGKGEYVAVLAVPGLLGAIGVFGLPNAVTYFSARGMSVRGLLLVGLLLTGILSVILISLVWFSMPWLEQLFHWDQETSVRIWYVPGGGVVSSFRLDHSIADLVRVVMIVVPSALLTTFAMSVLYGRQQVRTYSTILIGQAVVTLILSTLLVAVFRFGVPGAVASSIVVTWLAALADVVAVGMLARRMPAGRPVSLRSLAGYGIRAYPASITSYFNYRIDTYIIQAVMLAPEAPLGLYSMAVTMAELIFYVPDSVTMIFLPRIAGLSPEDADALLPRVSRLTVLLTTLAALAEIPSAWVGIHLILPRFDDCLPAFCVLLPAVISLSMSKVMSSYIAGRGRPGPISVGSTIAVCLNIAANLVLIPILGIVGAALASLISYTASAVFLLAVSCRLSHHSVLDLVVPRGEEVRILFTGLRQGLARARELARKHPTSMGGTKPQDSQAEDAS
jgi:O-antigen/teichoic acid export membrane protein